MRITNQAEAIAAFPLGTLFDELYNFVSNAPVNPDVVQANRITKTDVLNVISALKAFCLAYNIPRYDLFQMLFKEVVSEFTDKKPCSVSPLLCDWVKNKEIVLALFADSFKKARFY